RPPRPPSRRLAHSFLPGSPPEADAPSRARAGFPTRFEVSVMDLQLKGRKAIVTGASKGIGFQIAQTLLEEGVDVGICARNPDGVKQALGKLQAKGRAIGAPVDVTDSERYVSWIDSAAKELGGLDVFVHNVTAAPATPGLPGWELGYQTDIMGA